MSFKNLMKLKVMINTPTSEILSGMVFLPWYLGAASFQVFCNSPMMMVLVGKLIFTSDDSEDQDDDALSA